MRLRYYGDVVVNVNVVSDTSYVRANRTKWRNCWKQMVLTLILTRTHCPLFPSPQLSPKLGDSTRSCSVRLSNEFGFGSETLRVRAMKLH